MSPTRITSYGWINVLCYSVVVGEGSVSLDDSRLTTRLAEKFDFTRVRSPLWETRSRFQRREGLVLRRYRLKRPSIARFA